MMIRKELNVEELTDLMLCFASRREYLIESWRESYFDPTAGRTAWASCIERLNDLEIRILGIDYSL